MSGVLKLANTEGWKFTDVKDGENRDAGQRRPLHCRQCR